MHCMGVDWLQLAQERVSLGATVNTTLILRVP